MTDHTEQSAGSPPPGSRVSLNAKGLRALAHPVRMQLLGLLRRHGPSTATRLAERLSVNSGTASYHLRQLGAAGFVEEDSERGNARERWWRALHESTYLDDTELVEQDPDAAVTFMQSKAALHNVRTQQALSSYETLPRAWREATDMSDWMLRLTPEEAKALGDELHTVVERYRRASPQTAATAPEDAQHVALLLHLLPELDSPLEGGSPA